MQKYKKTEGSMFVSNHTSFYSMLSNGLHLLNIHPFLSNLIFCTFVPPFSFCVSATGFFSCTQTNVFLRFVPLMYFYAFVLQVLFLWCLSLRFRWTVPLFHQISNYCRSSLSGFSCVGCFYMNVSLLYVFIITASVYLSTHFSIKI